MTREEKEIALYCLKVNSDYYSEVCEECVKYPNCDHTIQDDVTETIIKVLEQEPCEDAISRQAVLDLINADWKYENLESPIENLPPVNPQEPKWIPVSEGLPEENIDVLICDSRGEMCIVWKGEGFERFSYEWDDGSGDIVAWMPLPKPYKAESEKE